MGSKVRKLLGTALPIAASFIPGIGPLGVAAAGAGGGFLGGGGLKGALAGGLGGYALGGGGGGLGGALGASGANASALGAGLLGAGAGGLTGGLKGALLGGALGGAGGYYQGGGFDGLGNSLGLTGEDGLFSGIGSSLGLGGTGATSSGFSGTPGENALLSKAQGALSGSGSPSIGGGTSSYSGLGSILSGASSIYANNSATDDILKSQQNSLDAIQPYLNAKFEPGDLTQDPGYQFQREQGEQALNRSLGAKGGLFSGNAIKAGTEFNNGLADSTYNQAFQRFLQQNGQNLGAANAAGQIFNNQGTAQANNSTNNANSINQNLAGLLGNGYFSSNGQGGGFSLSDLLRGNSRTSYGY